MTSVAGPDRREWICRVLQLAAGAGLAAHAEAAAPEWSPQVLTAAQDRALTAIGESIVPGSTAARVNRIIDLVLTMESEQTRTQLTSALETFADDAKDTMLTRASVDGAPHHAEFLVIKEWVADAYWSSEPGLRELGWTGKMAWSAYPGCEMPNATERKV